MKIVLSLLLIVSMTLVACNNSKNAKNNRVADSSFVADKQMKDSIIEQIQKDLNPEYAYEDSIADSKVSKYICKMVSGKHIYGGKTSITYMNPFQLIQRLHKDSKKRMTPPDELEMQIDLIKRMYSGGEIRLDVSRGTIGAVDGENFAIVIQDESGEELFRKSLPRNSAGGHSSVDDMWWNIAIINIPEKIRPPFNVFVVDDIGSEEPFKFNVKPIMK